jgi:hypothetical protein
MLYKSESGANMCSFHIPEEFHFRSTSEHSKEDRGILEDWEEGGE